jgi:hypothetical protein
VETQQIRVRGGVRGKSWESDGEERGDMHVQGSITGRGKTAS